MQGESHLIVFDVRFDHSQGIRGLALGWLESYLLNRTQSVTIDSVTSNEVLLKYGVPQGSVIGPMGYSMYTLPLGSIFEKHNMQYMLYADDSQGYTPR